MILRSTACLLLLLGCYLASGQTCLEGNCHTGKGTMLYPSGARYTGDFKNGQIHGRGTLIFTDGRHYTGEWSENFRHGQGKMRFAGGEIYEGAFARNQMHGQGTLYYPSGEKYTGQFIQGRMEGFGRRDYSDKSYYEGDWANGLRHGKGKQFFANGSMISGTWINDQYYNDKPNQPQPAANSTNRDCNLAFCASGQGRYAYKSGIQYFGDFNNGRPEGQGSAYFPNGDRYSGGWKNDKPHGRGEKRFVDGKILGAIWDFGYPAQVLYEHAAPVTASQPTQTKVPQINTEPVRIWAVIVGAARYLHLPALRYTDDDAYQIYAYLKSPEGGALPDRQIRLLIDEEASRKNMLESMELLFGQAGPNDVILFYFSGHGIEGAFLPIDYDGYNNRVFHREISQVLKKSRARHKVVFADACHSGSLLASRTGVQSTLQRYYTAFTQSTGGTALLLSSRGEEYSLEDSGLRSGIFSHFLIRGLKGEADQDYNHLITIRELFNFVYKEVRHYTGNIQSPILVGQFDEHMPIGSIR